MEELKNSKYHHFFKKHILTSITDVLLLLMVLSIGVYQAIKQEIIIVSIVLIIVIISIIVFLFNKNLLKQQVLVKISDKGIWLKTNIFVSWKDIKSMRIDKASLLLSLFSEGEFDNLEIRFKNIERQTITLNIHGLKNRKTLVALADNYIEKHK